LGVYIVTRARNKADDDTSDSSSSKEIVRAALLALAAAALYGIEGVLVSLGAQDVNSIVANSVRVPVVFVVSLLIAGQRGRWRQICHLDRRTVGLLILAGGMGWAVGGSFWVAAIRFAGPSRAAIVGSTAPLFAVPLSMIFLRERPTRYTLAGTALTVAGIMMVV